MKKRIVAGMSLEDLQKEHLELYKLMLDLRVKQKSSELKALHKLKQARRDFARVKTFLHQIKKIV